MEAQTKSKFADRGTWIRLIYMILFAVIFNVAELVTAVVVIVQFLFKLLTGKANEQLQTFGQNLGAYFQQMVGFLTYHTEDMPYPFGRWPGAASGRNPPAAAQRPAATSAEPEPAPTKKTPAKKKPKPAAKAVPKVKYGKPSGKEPAD